MVSCCLLPRIARIGHGLKLGPTFSAIPAKIISLWFKCSLMKFARYLCHNSTGAFCVGCVSHIVPLKLTCFIFAEH